MNQNFKLKLVAIVATLSGTAWSPVLAVQDGSAYTVPAQPAKVALAEPAWGGAFGTIRSAKPPAGYLTQPQLPPIVSGDHATVDRTSVDQFSNSTAVPPIISANSIPDSTTAAATRTPTTFTVPPIVVAAPPIVSAKTPIVSADVLPLPALHANSNMQANMLTPIKPLKSQVSVPLSNQSNFELDFTNGSRVAQATMETTQQSIDRMVAPAAQWQQSQSQAQGYLNTGFSSAGVPLYPTAQPKATRHAPPFAPTQDGSIDIFPAEPGESPTIMPPIITPGNQRTSPRNSVAPAIQDYRPQYTDQPQYTEYSTPGSSYAQPAPTPTYFNSPPMEAPVIGTTSGYSAGGVASAGSVAGCQSCGPNGCYDQGSIDARSGYFGAVSQARRYYNFDVLYFTRADGDIVFSNFGGLGSFEGDIGWRITLGERSDATQGREISYLGTSTLEESLTRFDAPGRLQALFVPSSFYSGAEASPFFGADRQDESKETTLHSVEFNKVSWGWDVIKSFVGLRYIYVDDKYSLISHRSVAEVSDDPLTVANEFQSAFDEQGIYRLNATNNLIGAHIGRELFYDVGYRLSFSGVGKAGVYANLSQFEATASKEILSGPDQAPAATFLNNKDENATLSTSLELNLFAHYQLNRRARLRAGYNALWLGEMATVSDNISGSLNPFLGTGTNDSDDMFFQGISFGLELYR